MAKDEEKAERIERLYNRGLLSIESGQYDYAITLLKDVLSLSPNFEKALEGIKLAKTRKMQQSGLISQKIRSVLFMIQAFLYQYFKKYEKALGKYESLFALMAPPPVMLPHLADVYLVNGMVQSATTAYKAVLQHDTEHVHSLRELGKIYLDQGEFGEAKSIYDRLSSLVGSDRIMMKEVHDAYALITIDKGRWQEEVSFRQKVAKETPGEVKEAAGGKEREVRVTGDSGERKRMIRMSLEKDRNNIALHRELAEVLLEENHIEEAISEYKKIADLDPEDVSVNETLAGLYRQTGNLSKAAKKYEELNELFPDRTDIRNILADLYREQDAPDKAIETYEKIIKVSPDDPDSHETLAKFYEQARYFDKAILEYEKVLTLAPERSHIEETLGSLYVRGGKNARAIEKFESLVEKDKANVGVRKMLADLYLGEDMLDKARAGYEEILRINPDDASSKASLKEIEAARLENKVDRIDEQIREYEKAAAAEPDNAEIKDKLKEAKLARLELHIQALEDRTKAEPENVEFHYQLGVAYKESAHFDKALKELQLAVNDETRSVESLHLIGLCFEEKNMLDIATRQLEKAVSKLHEMNDTRKAVVYDLGRIYEKMNQGQKALDKYKEIYEVDIGYRDVSSRIEKAYKQ